MSDDKIIKLEADKFIIREGEDSSQMYFLKSGTMAVYKTKGGVDKQIGTIYAGEVVGEMSFLDQMPRCASVKAITECELLEVPSDKFKKLFDGLPVWYKALVNTLLDRLRRANSRIRI